MRIISLDSSQTPGPVASPFDQAMTGLPTLWGRLMLASLEGRRQLEQVVAEAERFVASAELAAQVLAEGRAAPVEEVRAFVRMLVSAWPNASQGDLAGYAVQLRSDVEEHRPSVYALRIAGKTLRRTSRFLPSISDVLDALAEADKRIADAAKTIDRIPAALAEAKALLYRGDAA